MNPSRSNCFAAGGLNAGVADGQLLLGPKTEPLATAADLKTIRLLLSGVGSGAEVVLTLEAQAPGTGVTWTV